MLNVHDQAEITHYPALIDFADIFILVIALAPLSLHAIYANSTPIQFLFFEDITLVIASGPLLLPYSELHDSRLTA